MLIHRRESLELRRGWRAAALSLVSIVLLSACTTASPMPSVSETAPDELAGFYSQQVDWGSCSVDQFECAQITVPLDYADPSGDTIELAVNRHRATGNSRGVLFFNPGGPGGSAYDYSLSSLSYFFSANLLANFDIISMDPRGVQNSSPVTCFADPAEKDKFLYEEPTNAIGSAAYITEVREATEAFGAGCEKLTGALLGHVDTLSAAKDMDIVRAVLGAPTINMLGFSYGTLLGATYAGMFPERVGRFVLDGAEDPSLSGFELLYGQMVGLDGAIRSYLSDCLQSNPSCPFSGSVEKATSQLNDLIDSLAEEPLVADDGRTVGAMLLLSAVLDSMYTPSYQWDTLSDALADAQLGDPSGVLSIEDQSNNRNDDGTYGDNGVEAFYSVMCLDYPLETDAAVFEQQQQKLKAGSSILGRFYADGTQMCDGWPVPSVRTPASISATGSGPIMVIGNTGDPVTPLAWAKALVSQLDNGFLVTNDEIGHTAYNAMASKCIVGAVDNFLIKGTEPQSGLECESS